MTDSEKDERIRLLEFQTEFLRRELTFVMRRYDAIRWSAAWTIARPVKRVEDFLHAAVKRVRLALSKTRESTPVETRRGVETATTAEAIAARIARKIGRPSAEA